MWPTTVAHFRKPLDTVTGLDFDTRMSTHNDHRDSAEEATNLDLMDTADGMFAHAECSRRSREGHEVCGECEEMMLAW